MLPRRRARDVIVLDIMLPKIDGLSVLRQLREQRSPSMVLFLTAKDTPQDRVAGLELGADDYLVKPFVFAELLARVRAMIRRKYETTSTILRVADLEIDTTHRMVKRGGKMIDLSGREFALIEYLGLNAGRIVSRSDIWQHVYDFNASPESNVVDVYVGLLRKKIEREGSRKLIHTRRGQGYILQPSWSRKLIRSLRLQASWWLYLGPRPSLSSACSASVFMPASARSWLPNSIRRCSPRSPRCRGDGRTAQQPDHLRLRALGGTSQVRHQRSPPIILRPGSIPTVSHPVPPHLARTIFPRPDVGSDLAYSSSSVLPDGRMRPRRLHVVPMTTIEPNASGNSSTAERPRKVLLSVATESTSLHEMLENLQWILFLSCGLAVALSGATLMWVSGRAVRPVERLARDIEQLREYELSARLASPDAPTELQPVVDKLNGLLVRISAAFAREKAFTADAWLMSFARRSRPS